MTDRKDRAGMQALRRSFRGEGRNGPGGSMPPGLFYGSDFFRLPAPLGTLEPDQDCRGFSGLKGAGEGLKAWKEPKKHRGTQGGFGREILGLKKNLYDKPGTELFCMAEEIPLNTMF